MVFNTPSSCVALADEALGTFSGAIADFEELRDHMVWMLEWERNTVAISDFSFCPPLSFIWLRCHSSLRLPRKSNPSASTCLAPLRQGWRGGGGINIYIYGLWVETMSFIAYIWSRKCAKPTRQERRRYSVCSAPSRTYIAMTLTTISICIHTHDILCKQFVNIPHPQEQGQLHKRQSDAYYSTEDRYLSYSGERNESFLAGVSASKYGD